MVVTGSVDHCLKVWDLRFPERELMVLRGHNYAVRRVKCSPHSGNILASASYDMTMRIWDTALGDQPMVHVHDQHTEFVLGVDLSMFFEGQVATCAWDEHIDIVQVPIMTMKR